MTQRLFNQHKYVQSSFEEFNKVEKSLRSIEESIVQTLRFMSVDDKNITVSSNDLHKELLESQNFYEQRRLERRKEIEEKYQEQELIRAQKLRESQVQADIRRQENEQKSKQQLEDALNNMNQQGSGQVAYEDSEGGKGSQSDQNNVLENINEINHDLRSEKGKDPHEELSSLNHSEAGSRIDFDEGNNNNNNNNNENSQIEGGEMGQEQEGGDSGSRPQSQQNQEQPNSQLNNDPEQDQ